jgi:hypothetical protein
LREEAKLTRTYHFTTQESLEDLKALIDGTKEDLEDQLAQVRQTIGAADASSVQLLQVDLTRLHSSLESIAQAQRIADTVRPEVVIKHNRAGQGARGIFGTDTPQPQFDLTVSGNEAEIGATMSAGGHSPETLQALLANSPTPNLALALQALQTQSSQTSHEYLQSILDSSPAEGQRGIIGLPSETISPVPTNILDDVDTTRIITLGRSTRPARSNISNADEVTER